jgi:hypothetical protein
VHFFLEKETKETKIYLLCQVVKKEKDIKWRLTREKNA